MATLRTKSAMKRFVTDYGMVFVLLLLCVYYSFATWAEQHPDGRSAAVQTSKMAGRQCDKGARVLVVAGKGKKAGEFAAAAPGLLAEQGLQVVGVAQGTPFDLRAELDGLAGAGTQLDAIVATRGSARGTLLTNLPTEWPTMAKVTIISPRSYWWPDFLLTSNLANVADNIVVIAIIAIGMTMVIITGGIDLSVGSLIALSAVLAMLMIRELAGAEDAGALGMVLCCLGAIVACGVVGTFSGLMVAGFSVPPFIGTLAMMLVARGLAFIFAGGKSIYEVPGSIAWLGRGEVLPGVANTLVLMVILYAAAHILMTRTVLGRYIYAVGGNVEAARLSGVPVRRVLLFVYALCGALAGIGGVIQASQLKSAAGDYAEMYELYVIAAVVVGGTSLAGGRGKILGTLIGAFIIAVIQNGMNLTGVESYEQKVVLGVVILGAVLLDMLKNRDWRGLRFLRRLGAKE